MNQTSWKHANGSWIKVEEVEAQGEAPTKEEQRKAREENLAYLRSQRETFWMPPMTSLDEDAERLGRVGPVNAAWELREAVLGGIAQRNAIAHLSARLRCLIHERDCLEAAYREEKAEREIAEGQRKIADAALARTCAERDALKKQLRDLAPARKAKASKDK